MLAPTHALWMWCSTDGLLDGGVKPQRLDVRTEHLIDRLVLLEVRLDERLALGEVGRHLAEAARVQAERLHRRENVVVDDVRVRLALTGENEESRQIAVSIQPATILPFEMHTPSRVRCATDASGNPFP